MTLAKSSSGTAPDESSPSAVSENWRKNKRLTAAWDWGVKSWPVAMVYGVLVFATDNRKLYAHMDRLGELPEGTSVLDVPSGGGVVLRAFAPRHKVRYVAADISPLMLDKVRVEAGRRGLDFVETEEADITALPFEDGAFDVVVTYNGLHCVPDPAGAVMEMARVLRPGGELRGCLVVTKTGFVPDTFIGLWRRTQILDVVVPADDFLGWLAAAGLEIVTTARSGAVLYFDARKPDTGPAEAGAAEGGGAEGGGAEAKVVEGGAVEGGAAT